MRSQSFWHAIDRKPTRGSDAAPGARRGSATAAPQYAGGEVTVADEFTIESRTVQGISGPATPWPCLHLHRSAATRPPDFVGGPRLRKFKGFRACDGARGRASRLCRARGKEHRIDRPRGAHTRTRALGGSRMGGALSVSLLAFRAAVICMPSQPEQPNRLCAVSEVSGASTEYRRLR